MKKMLGLVAILFLFAGCGNAVMPNAHTDATAGESIPVPHDGEVLYKTDWQDANGKNVFWITGQVDYQEGYGTAEMRASHSVLREHQWEEIWTYEDTRTGNGCDLDIEIPLDKIVVEDVMNDGLMDVVFFYWIDTRCDASAHFMKMIHHVGEEHFGIYGYGQQYLGPPEEVQNTFLAQDNMGPVSYKSFIFRASSFDIKLREYASDIWDAYIDTEDDAYQEAMEGR